MSRKNKSLPTPPSAGNRFREEERGEGPLMADQMAMAAAAGKIDQFFEKALPDSEHARKLATMMMGMTGMMPPRTEPPPAAGQNQPQDQSMNQSKNQPMNQSIPGASAEPASATPEAPTPDEVLQAVRNGDVKGLMDLLKHEHSKRAGDASADIEPGASPQQPSQPSRQQQAPRHHSPQLPGTSIEKVLIDRVLAISVENDVTPDWVVTRALKLYVEGYEKTGRL